MLFTATSLFKRLRAELAALTLELLLGHLLVRLAGLETTTLHVLLVDVVAQTADRGDQEHEHSEDGGNTTRLNVHGVRRGRSNAKYHEEVIGETIGYRITRESRSGRITPSKPSESITIKSHAERVSGI